MRSTIICISIFLLFMSCATEVEPEIIIPEQKLNIEPPSDIGDTATVIAINGRSFKPEGSMLGVYVAFYRSRDFPIQPNSLSYFFFHESFGTVMVDGVETQYYDVTSDLGLNYIYNLDRTEFDILAIWIKEDKGGGRSRMDLSGFYSIPPIKSETGRLTVPDYILQVEPSRDFNLLIDVIEVDQKYKDTLIETILDLNPDTKWNIR